jgi:transposase-like protein
VSQVRPRLTPYSRLLLVQRAQQRPVAHVAAELGVSRQTASRWVRRYRAEGEAGLLDRSSRPRHQPHRTPPAVEAQVLALRAAARRGPVWLAAQLGACPSTIGRILARHQVPLLRDLDPITGARLRATRRSANRYERDQPGELVHVDVKKLGRIPEGAAGGCTAELPTPGTAMVLAMTSSMSPSTITPGWPTPRSWPTSGPRPAPGS